MRFCFPVLEDFSYWLHFWSLIRLQRPRTVLRDVAWWYWWSWLTVPGLLVNAKFSSAGIYGSLGPVLCPCFFVQGACNQWKCCLSSQSYAFIFCWFSNVLQWFLDHVQHSGSLRASATTRKRSVWHYASSELRQDLSVWPPYIYTSLVPWQYCQYDTTHHQSYDKTYQCDPRTSIHH